MSRLVAVELLKLRTTRGPIGYVLATLALAGIGVAGTIGSAPEIDRQTPGYLTDLLSTAGVAGLVALLLGVTAVTVEWRHGTVTPTFLATPARTRIVVAKALSGTIVGALLAVLALLVVLAVALPWLQAIGAGADLDRAAWERAAGVVAGAALSGALGAAVGSAVQSQVPAIVGVLLWVLVAEPLLGALLGLVDADRVADVLPGATLGALDGSVDDALRWWVGGLVSLAWIGGIGALGVWRTRRADVT